MNAVSHPDTLGPVAATRRRGPEFQQLASGIDVLPALLQLRDQPELWDALTERTTDPASPHHQVSDIWLRSIDRADVRERADYLRPHHPVWYPAWAKLPALRPIVFGLTSRVEATAIGTALITRLASGAQVLPHDDAYSWAARYYNAKVYVPLAGGPGCLNRCLNDTVAMLPGTAWTFDNCVEHSVENGDPVQTVGKLLRSPTAQADMARLADATAANPAARAGLQRAVADSILRDLQGDQGTVTGTESTMRSADFQKFIRQSEPALRAVLDDKQVAALKAVADDLHRSGLSVSGTRVAGGSDTVQNKGAVSLAVSLGRSGVSELGTSIRSLGPSAGAAAGYYAGGAPGAALGAVLGAGPMVARAVAAARAAGLNTVNDLVREAMLNPQLAQVLLARVTPKNQANVAGALVAALNRLNVASEGDQRRRQRVPAPLMRPQAMLVPLPGRTNALMGLMG